MKKKVLLCDDDEALVRIITFMLRSESIDLSIVFNGADFLKKVTEVMPDLVLLDLMLPDTDGYSLLQAMKNDARTASIKVIVMSGLESREHIDGALRMGAADYIVKPFNPAQFKETVLKHLV